MLSLSFKLRLVLLIGIAASTLAGYTLATEPEIPVVTFDTDFALPSLPVGDGSGKPVCVDEASGLLVAGCLDAQLPVGVNSGDMLYWDGSAWQLTPAPAPTVACNHNPVLTLTNNVPTWTCFYDIGDIGPVGGIVFHVTDNGLHGLEAAPEDQDSAPWGCNATEIRGADGIALGSGAQNTVDILAGCIERPIAASVAANYVWPDGEIGGFLPSKGELGLLNARKTLVDDVFAESFYYSSSEDDSINVWNQTFQDSSDSDWYSSPKNFTRGVRAVRAF